MTNDELLFKNRMRELSRRADDGGYYTASPFLTLAEQTDLAAWQREGEIGRYTLFGGYAGAERKLALFGDEDAFGYPPSVPCLWLKIAPSAPKFADALSHRDLLGALMSLGIERSVLGDILLHNNIGYLYAAESIAPYLLEALTRIKHTDVLVTVTDAPPALDTLLPEPTAVVVAGERLDCYVAAAFRLSRSEAAALIEKGLVSLNGKPITKISATVPTAAVVSVRGHGRFLYEGIVGDTRKNKLRIAIRLFS